MRGKGTLFEQREQMQRITPAYAGKSLSGLSVRLLYRDHPRLCGEKFMPIIFSGIRHRITPAYAGKSFDTNDAEVQRRDHPRLCGEKAQG